MTWYVLGDKHFPPKGNSELGLWWSQGSVWPAQSHPQGSMPKTLQIPQSVISSRYSCVRPQENQDQLEPLRWTMGPQHTMKSNYYGTKLSSSVSLPSNVGKCKQACSAYHVLLVLPQTTSIKWYQASWTNEFQDCCEPVSVMFAGSQFLAVQEAYHGKDSGKGEESWQTLSSF